MSMNIGGSSAAPRFFQIQAGKLDQQAKDFILKNDTNKDGELSQAEVQAAGGLTPGVRSRVSSASTAASLWAGVTGPSGGIGAKEYAQFLVALDFDRDGKVTQDESDATMASWSKFIEANPKVAHSSIYAALVKLGNDIGLDKVLDNSDEEAVADALANGRDPSTLGSKTPPVSNDTVDAGLPIVGGSTVATTTAPTTTMTSGSLADRLKAVPGLDSSIVASLVAVVGGSTPTPAVETVALPLVQ